MGVSLTLVAVSREAEFQTLAFFIRGSAASGQLPHDYTLEFINLYIFNSRSGVRR